MALLARISPPTLSTTFVLALAACGDDGGSSIYSGGEESVTVTLGEADDEADASSSDTTATSTTNTTNTEAEDSSSTGTLFDVGMSTADDGMGMADTCQKVDVLYVIDNSPSMYEEQQTLIANFDAFTSDMQTALANVDSYHIGAITSDNYIEEGFLDDSTDVVNASFPECRVLGGLVVQAQQGTCKPFAAGDNWITEADVLAAKFGCIANVGEDGDSDERMGTALVNAVTLGSQPGGCNGGFIRNDALLIVVLLTDENDSSDTTPQDWYDELVAIKGAETNIVMLSLTWDEFENNCDSELSESTGYTIVEFTELFTNHATGNICDSDYSGFFANAIPTIESACDMFEPVG
jgi:hypothetical protein